MLAIGGQPRGLGGPSFSTDLAGLVGRFAAFFVARDLRDVSPISSDDRLAKHGIVLVLFEAGGRLSISAKEGFGAFDFVYCCRVQIKVIVEAGNRTDRVRDRKLPCFGGHRGALRRTTAAASYKT